MTEVILSGPTRPFRLRPLSGLEQMGPHATVCYPDGLLLSGSASSPGGVAALGHPRWVGLPLADV